MGVQTGHESLASLNVAGGLRVLYVIDSLVPGGAETSLAAMAPHLRNLGVGLHVVYFHDRAGLQEDLSRAGAVLHRVDGGRINRVKGLLHLIETVDPDLVHTTLFEADQAGRLAGRIAHRPVVTSYVSTGFELGPWHSTAGVRARSAALLDGATAHLVSAFHAVSDPVADAMAERARVPRDRFTVIPRGRDALSLGRWSTGRRTATRARLAIDEETPIILAVGRQVGPKDLTTLIRALPQVHDEWPKLQVLLAGAPGPQSSAIEQAIAESQLDSVVRTLGHRTDVADLMVAADVLALPSLREGFPGTLVEALALECPIVATDIPSVRSVVDGPSGLVARLVPVSDSAALGHAIADVLRLRPRRTFGSAGRVLFESCYTIEATSEQMYELYCQVVNIATTARSGP